MSIKLTFEIVFKSDYHVSDGQRFGLAVDSALLRDHNQSPVLRGTALAGLFRDGFYDLQDLIDSSILKPSNPLDIQVEKRLFGSPEVPKTWFFSSTKLLKKGNGRWGSNDVWRNRINPRTRRAEPQKLFVEEKGDGRLRFTFTVTCETESDESRADGAVLIAVASMVRQLGSGRRRGNGQCAINLISAENFIQKQNNDTSWQDEALTAFQSYWLEGKALPAAPEKKDDDVVDDNGKPKRLRVIARLAEPVIVAKKSQVANAFETLQTIPGTVLLGALANRAAKQADIRKDSDAHQQFVEMFFRGGVSVSGLLPAIEKSNLYPSVMAPQAWAQCEVHPQFAPEQSEYHHDFSDLSQPLDNDNCSVCNGKMKPVRGFINLRGHRFHDIATREEIHITMKRETGRVEEGNLFTYEMISAGQWFVGELTCNAGNWTHLQKMTGMRANKAVSLRLGKATRRGYGLTHLFLEEMNDDEASPWVLTPVAKRISEDEEAESHELTLLLLTDAILVDSWGRFQQGINEKILANILGVTDSQISKVEAFVNGRILDSFNTYRRMPRWRDEVITAGSMVRFVITGINSKQLSAVLKNVEKGGIGLRRHEGFGCVAFNHPVFNSGSQINGISLNNVDKALLKLADKNSNVVQAAERIHGERDFSSKEWQKKLDRSWNKKKPLYESLDDKYEALTRLIYLYRYRPVADLLTWFDENGENNRSLNDEQNLWGNRKLVGREKQPKLDLEVVKEIKKLLTQLVEEPQTWQTIGMTMLAEALGAQIDKNRKVAQANAQKEVAHG